LDHGADERQGCFAVDVKRQLYHVLRKALAVVQAMDVGELIIRVSGDKLKPADAKISVMA
jgi:hypothetical protein